MLVRDCAMNSSGSTKSRKRDNRHRLLHAQWIKSGKPYLTGSPRPCNYR
jgi:hypothetical protein